MVKLHKKVESRSLFDFVQALVRSVGDGGGKNMSAAENLMRVYVLVEKRAYEAVLAGSLLERS